MKLTNDQLRQFEEQGYLFFPSLFRPDEMKVLLDQLPDIYAQHRPEIVREKGSDAVRTVFAGHLINEAFAKLGRHPRMIEPVQALLGEQVYMHQFKINGKQAFDGDVWQWHQDYGTWKADDDMPEPRAMNIAVFLDDVNEFNGPLLFIPGSHRGGAIDAGHDVSTTSYPLWTLDNETVARLVAQRRNRGAEGPGRFDADVPLVSRPWLAVEHEPVEPEHLLPQPVRGLEPHPPLPSSRVHRPPRLHSDRAVGRRLPDQPRGARHRPAPRQGGLIGRGDPLEPQSDAARAPGGRQAAAHRPDRRRQVRLDVPVAGTAHTGHGPGRRCRPGAGARPRGAGRRRLAGRSAGREVVGRGTPRQRRIHRRRRRRDDRQRRDRDRHRCHRQPGGRHPSRPRLLPSRQAHRDGQRRGRCAGRAAARPAGARSRDRLLARLWRPAGADLRNGRLGALRRVRGDRRRQGHEVPSGVP